MTDERKTQNVFFSTIFFFSFFLCSDLFLPSHIPLLTTFWLLHFSLSSVSIIFKTLYKTLIQSFLKLSLFHFQKTLQNSDFASQFPEFDSRRRGTTQAYATLLANYMPETVVTSAWACCVRRSNSSVERLWMKQRNLIFPLLRLINLRLEDSENTTTC